ncbi:MAG: HD-GYP domain-containing protein [Lachnospiraceae bacterium]|nr:HD-GYP domain-containing protein [Lachnospiraceae bacterium]
MEIDQTIVDHTGRKLICRGTILDEYMIASMLKMGIMGVYIGEGQDEDTTSDENLSPAIRETIEKNTVADQARVQLSESVKQRVSEGIRYLYNNAESEDFTQTTNSIANNLMNAVLENDSIAVDIDTLKVSDEYTFKHSVDVATMAMVVARKHGFSDQEIYEIGVSGLLHDVGKSRIPNEILNKPGRLTEEEFSIMKQHSLYGYRILQDKPDISNEIRLGVLQHHEKINGNGYPLSVPKEQICSYARILSIVDIYDALVTERPYKKGFSKRDAVEMIMAMTDELDISYMRSFLNSVILYPVGSTVQLSNGENARVVAGNPESILRPKVVGLKTGKLYDLLGDLSCASIVIL